jgi:hypothetical protein
MISRKNASKLKWQQMMPGWYLKVEQRQPGPVAQQAGPWELGPLMACTRWTTNCRYLTLPYLRWRIDPSDRLQLRATHQRLTVCLCL